MTDQIYYAYGVVPADSLEATDEEPLDVAVEGVCGTTSISTVTHRTLAAVVTEVETMDPERSDENVRAHDEVLRTVMTHGDGRPVVPMRFGMTFKNGRTLKHVLRNGRRAFTEALRRVEDKMELGVTVVSETDADLDVEAMREDIGTRFADISAAETEDDLYSDRLVLNRSYLVNQDDRPRFDDVIDEIREEYADDATVKYTGPWAPYNFVDIEIGAEG